ncbi:hypothetical protein KAH37_06365 [bacterium]|nr:hypothetical protein [bacterium]
MKRILLVALLLLSLVWFAGCDKSSSEYDLHSVSSLTLSPFMTNCSSGIDSYLLFVADEEREETRVKLIDGCSGSFVSNFDDPFDGDTGLLVDGAVQALAAAEKEEGEVGIVLALAGTGTINPADNEGKKGSFLRFYSMSAITDIPQEGVKEIALSEVTRFLDTQGTLFTGVTETSAYTVDKDFSKIAVDGNFPTIPVNYACHEKYCLLHTKDGLLYKHTASTPLESIDVGITEKIRGVFSINKERWAISTESSVYLFDSELLPVVELKMPEMVKAASVTYLEVEDSFYYRLLAADSASEKVALSIEETTAYGESDEDINETPDIDDESYEFPDDDTLPDSVFDAKKHDIIVVATQNGAMLLFDIDSDGWMVRHFTSDDPLSSEEIIRRNRMQPFLYRYFRRYPDDDETEATTAPFLTDLQVRRNLHYTIQYTAVFEGVSQLLTSHAGQFDDSAMVLGDKTLSFADYNLHPGEGRLLITSKRNLNSACTIPPSATISMGIESELSEHLLQVSMDSYADSVNACFGPLLSYSLYPENRYLISLIDPLFRTYETIGDEFPAGSGGSDFTHSDILSDFRIEKGDDSIKTMPGVTHILTIKPSIYYLGYQSRQVFEWSRQPIPGRLLLFSMTRRYIADYDPLEQILINDFK